MSEHKKKKNPAATMMMTSLAYIVLGIVTVVFRKRCLMFCAMHSAVQ